MNKFTKSAVALALTLGAAGAYAIPYVEVGDAAQLIPGQAVDAGTTSISGFLDQGDADLFSFIWDGGALTIDTFGTSWDTQLFLFDSAGLAVIGDDDAGGTLQSELPLASLAAGTYYLGISAFNNDPTSGGVILDNGGGNMTPGAGPLDGWLGGGGTGGAYTINFSAATGGATGVPEPASLALLGLGFLGLVAARRRKG